MNVQTYSEGMDLAGFIEGMPNEAYHASEGISKSGLDRVTLSPAHYRYPPDRSPSPAMKIGTAIHTAILEPERFDDEYQVVDVKDRRQKAWKDAVAEFGDELVLLRSEYESIRAIQTAAFARPEVKRLAHAEGWAELSAFGVDPETGVKVRCRFDHLAAAGFAVDLKKARDVFERGFSRSCAAYRYHVQVAFYSDVYEWITGEKLTDFWLIAIEDQSPFTVVPYRLDDLAIEAGRIAYRRDLNTYAHCLACGDWPHYEPESSLLCLPEWALSDMDDELEIA